jgi:hypothetical protein
MKASPEDTAKALAAAVAPPLSVNVAAIESAAKAKPKKRNRNPDVVTGLPGQFAVTLALPCRVVSEMNQRGHWGAKAGRFKKQREILVYALRELGFYSILKDEFRWPFGFPAVVTFMHVGPELDDDNIRSAFKGLRDQVAEWAGIDDKDKRIEWVYDQHAGEPGVEIRIEARQ